jgi:hypothetical protein
MGAFTGMGLGACVVPTTIPALAADPNFTWNVVNFQFECYCPDLTGGGGAVGEGLCFFACGPYVPPLGTFLSISPLCGTRTATWTNVRGTPCVPPLSNIEVRFN